MQDWHLSHIFLNVICQRAVSFHYLSVVRHWLYRDFSPKYWWQTRVKVNKQIYWEKKCPSFQMSMNKCSVKKGLTCWNMSGFEWTRERWRESKPLCSLILTLVGDIDGCGREQLPNIWARQGGEESHWAGERWLWGRGINGIARGYSATFCLQLYPSHLMCSLPPIGEGVLGATDSDL